MWSVINDFLVNVDNFVWGVPLMVLIMAGGLLLTVRLGLFTVARVAGSDGRLAIPRHAVG